MNTTKFKKALCIFLTLAVYTTCLKADNLPKWKISLTEAGIATPAKIQQLESGIIVVSSPNAICGIDPYTHSVLWKYDFNVPVIKTVPGTDLIYLKVSEARTILLDPVQGREIFDTGAEAVWFEESFLPNGLNMFFIYATNGKLKRKYLYAFDLQAAELKWAKDVGEGSSNTAKRLFSAIGVNTMVEKYRIMLTDAENNVLFINDKKITRFNPENGEALWEQEMRSPVSRATVVPDKKILFLNYVSQQVLELINVADGSKILPKPLKAPGSFISITPYGDEALVITDGGLNIFDFATHSFKWKKSPSTGYISYYRVLDNGFLTINETQPDYSYVYFVDTSGQKVWHRYMDKLAVYDICNRGLFYGTDSNINIMDFSNKGKDAWVNDLPIVSKNTYYYYNAGTQVLTMLVQSKLFGVELPFALYSFDLNKGEHNLLNKDIVFDDKEGVKQWIAVEETANGYIIYTAQNLILFDKEGKITYRKNYPLVGFFKDVLIERPGFSGMLFDAFFGQEQETTYVGAQKAGRRRTATTATQDRLFIMTECASAYENEKYPCIIAVEKATGKESSRLEIKDLNPLYIVDTIDNRIYLLLGTELICYEL
jgi:outer membrane protein assembly factor BamB